MATQEIRLRLAVRRHGVPEVMLVWPCKRSADMTIAKLLASVNEVVPLESSQWGLEDYAVELVGVDGATYECLHFQLVAQTLKDEDQLIIRPLSTDDVRRRRLSGRHQISTDGKHLIDGVAFGRPWLRAPRDRPALELPPRKRARTEAHEMDMAEPQRLLMLEAPQEHDDDDEDDDDDDDEWIQDEGGNSGKHAWGPEGDGSSISESSGSDQEDFKCSREELVDEVKALREAEHDAAEDQSDTNECSVEHLAAIRTAYPLLSFATIEKELLKQKQNLRKTYEALQQSTTPSLTFDDMMDRMVTGILDQSETSPVQEETVDIFNRQPPSKKPLIEELVSEEESGSSSSISSSSDDTSSEDESNSDGDSKHDDDDDDDDEDDYSDEEGSSFHGASVSSSGGSSDDSSDDSGDDSSSDSSDESDSEPVKAPDTNQVQQGSAPFQGLSRTQKRNARRRKQKASRQQMMTTPSSGDAELRARKEALLGALQAHVTNERQSSVVDVEAKANTPINDQKAGTCTPTETPAQRRTRVDMGAGRRMLFGALGLKNPKSKADEERIKLGLMKDVKPLSNARIVEVMDGNAKQTTDGGAGADEWKSKITYRAVECCHEGMALSEPPFPFVQRWDPQQQYGSMRKRKRKSEEFDADYYGPSPSSGSKSTTRDPFKGEAEGTAAQADGDGVETVGNGINGHVEAEEADLPEPPEDPSTLPTLEKGAAKEGMVITWKQCTMSKATQWQPVIKSVTGEVLSDGDESGVEVRLAFRDREYTEKLFDEKTGQRIYDKFETPDFEDEDEEEDGGFRTVAWEDMTDPRILAATSPWAATKETEA